MVKPPCKKNGVHCTKRHQGCHDVCPEFRDFKIAKDKERELILKQRKAENDVVAARQRGLRRTLKSLNNPHSKKY